MKKAYILFSLLLIALIVSSNSFSRQAEQIKLKKADAATFFRALNRDTMYLVDEFYAQDVHFKDPIVEFHNRDDMKHYYASAYESTDSVTFEVPKVVMQGNEQVVIWIMTMKSKGLNKGKPVIVEGTSHIRYNNKGKAVYHRDYFDMGQMVYSHVPFVRGMIRFVNKRMRKMHDPTYKK